MSNHDPFIEKILGREIIFKGKYLNLEKLKLLLPNQSVAEREIVRVRDAVAVIPVDHKKRVHLVRQHRPAIKTTILEIPAGLRDQEERLETAAERECEEETGYRPRMLKKLLTYAHAEGYSTGFITLFLGTQLEYTGEISLDATEYLEQEVVDYSTLCRMVDQNQIIDSKTILSTLLIGNLI